MQGQIKSSVKIPRTVFCMLQNLVIMLFFMLTICTYYALECPIILWNLPIILQEIFIGSLERTCEMCRVSPFNVLTKLLNSLELHGPCYFILVTCFWTLLFSKKAPPDTLYRKNLPHDTPMSLLENCLALCCVIKQGGWSWSTAWVACSFCAFTER